MESAKYYLGLDIGTDSVGYAVTDGQYRLCKRKGEPVWGTTMFEAASLSDERRTMRVARRRYDRRQQRVSLLEELFAPEIVKIDPNFFIRRRESALFAEDTQFGVKLFEGGITDEAYHRRYPTIHHLLVELMKSGEVHDVRLVYIACAYLVAHRGHFLFDMAADVTNNFSRALCELKEYLQNECECGLPWQEDLDDGILLDIMTAQCGVKRKQELFVKNVYGGKKPAKKAEDGFPYSRDGVMSLLCGGKVRSKDLFLKDEYAMTVELSSDEEKFGEALAELGEDGELLRRLRAVYDSALLTQTLGRHEFISDAKVAIYEQHKSDLAYLKCFVRKYAPAKYDLIFRGEEADNYVAYSGNVKSCKAPQKAKSVQKDKFCEFLLKQLKDIQVEEADREKYEDMQERLKQNTFLPKQRDSDNRVIPHQVYAVELDRLLEKAAAYLPMLTEKDEDGLSNADKIRAIFSFRIPYYVGPLNRNTQNSWVVRKSGTIYPWNFDKLVDLDATEEGFIRRMTNYCTYLPGEEVLPQKSLLYTRFVLLNEINNLKINDRVISPDVKQELVTELYKQSGRKITPKAIREILLSRGYLEPADEIGGIDVTIKASLKPYHSFRRLLENGALTEEQAEDIIRHAAYSEDRSRMKRWLNRQYPSLPDEDIEYILRLDLKGFGRLSRRLLTGVYHTDNETGEMLSIMDMLWRTNRNLMQLLSGNYTFRQKIESFATAYYKANPQSLTERLDDMYISNAVKRPIFRTLKITEEVVKCMGGAPEKIFIEMSRDSDGSKRGKRTISRYQQVLALYKRVKTEDARELEKELAAMGDKAENMLQGDKLFLYFMQMGRCAYTWKRIDLSRLATKAYDIDHIYPQSKVYDDSILNNKVLCTSEYNGSVKQYRYPVKEQTRDEMRPHWEFLLKNSLMEKEKFRRLTRNTDFTDEELHQFINRQLVETRQSTKAVAQLLKERYPDAEIVYVKAGLVSRFRQEFDMLKSRAVNDLHHAKDAYLNIVAGNVYHEKFTRRYFDTKKSYSLKIKPLFGNPVQVGGKTVWRGGEDIALVKRTMSKNAAHLTRYAFCRRGTLFDVQPQKAGSGLVPRKANLPAEKYGGYNKTKASFYMLASCIMGGKKDIMFVPIELMYADRVMADAAFALEYVAGEISKITGKQAKNVELLLGGRKIRISTIIEADGMRMALHGKSSGGTRIIISPCMPLILGTQLERYVKRLEAFKQKVDSGAKIEPDAAHDHITPEENLALYDVLCNKLTSSVFAKCPGNIAETVVAGRGKFETLQVKDQITCLLSIISWFGNVKSCDLKSIGGAGNAGIKLISAKLGTLKSRYSDVRIVDVSASGLFESRSGNLMELL